MLYSKSLLTNIYKTWFIYHYCRSSKSPQTWKIAVAKNVDKLKALAEAEEEATRRLAEIEVGYVSC